MQLVCPIPYATWHLEDVYAVSAGRRSGSLVLLFIPNLSQSLSVLSIFAHGLGYVER